MAALLGDNIAQDNGSLAETEGMHPALYCWREQLPAAIVRMLAYLGGIALLSIAVAQIFQPSLRTARQQVRAAVNRHFRYVERQALPRLRARL